MLRTGMLVDGRYQIIRELGRGGTSCVYLAKNIRLQNYLAIKEVYKSGFNVSDSSWSMIVAESRILTKLRHPGLPSVIDILNTPQSFLIVMEYIEGISLEKVLQQKGACSQSDVLKWGAQLCGVLDYLHRQTPPIIYRDMKPANIMLRPNGDIVLIDFGMAREFKKTNLKDTTNLGTHGFAAPEQYNGLKQTDARTDIYSLGVTLYNLVTGIDPCVPPYGIRSICSVNPSLSPRLDYIIKKCTEIEADSRFQTAAELKRALESVNSGSPYDEDDSDSPKKTGKKTLFAVCGIIAAVLVMLIVAIVIATNAGNQADDLYYEQQVYISSSDHREYFSFVPEKTGNYRIYSVSGNCKPVIWLTDHDDNLLGKENTKGEFDDFLLACKLYAGETYYLETTLYDLDPDSPSTGSYYIYIEYEQ